MFTCVGRRLRKQGRLHGDSAKQGAGTRLERFHASTSDNAFWLPRGTPAVLSREMDVVTSQLLVDAAANEYERKSRSRPRRGPRRGRLRVGVAQRPGT